MLCIKSADSAVSPIPSRGGLTVTRTMFAVLIVTDAGSRYATPSSIATPRYDVSAPVTPGHPDDPRPAGVRVVRNTTVVAARYVMTPTDEIRACATDSRTLVPAGIECMAAISEHEELTAVPVTAVISSAT